MAGGGGGGGDMTLWLKDCNVVLKNPDTQMNVVRDDLPAVS